MSENKIQYLLDCLRNENCDFSTLPPEKLLKIKNALKDNNIEGLQNMLDVIELPEATKNEIKQECIKAVSELNDDEQKIILRQLIKPVGGRRYRCRRRTRKGVGKGKQRIIKSRRVRGGNGSDVLLTALLGICIALVTILVAACVTANGSRGSAGSYYRTIEPYRDTGKIYDDERYVNSVLAFPDSARIQ